MNYTTHGQLIAILITGAIVFSLDWLVRSLLRDDPPQPTTLKVMKVIAVFLMLIPVALSPFLFIIIPSMKSYYFLQLLIGIVFIVSFLTFEAILTRVPPIILLSDKLALILIETFISVSNKIYQPVISRLPTDIRSQFISILMRFDIHNHCAELVIREFDNMNAHARARAYQYDYVWDVPVMNGQSARDIFVALSRESQREQERIKGLSREAFWSGMQTPMNSNEVKIP